MTTPDNRATAGRHPRRTNTRNDQVLQELLDALTALKRGDLDVRISSRRSGLEGKIAAAFNDFLALFKKNNSEIDRVARVVGREGRMSERVEQHGGGAWSSSANSINGLIDDLIRPTTEIGRVIDAVAQGDLSHKISSPFRVGRSRASSCGSALR